MLISNFPSLNMRGRVARRNAALAAAALAAVLHAGVASGQSPRIAYVTSWRIIGPEAEFQGTRDAEQALNRDVESWNRELDERKQEIDALEKEIEQKRLVISESKRQELDQQRSQKKGELERRAKEIYGDGGLIERRNLELTKAIMDKVKEAVTAIARDEGYDFVFDASDANLVWANKEFDITDKVLTKLNEATRTAPGSATPAAPPPVVPPGGRQ
jgi:outer membrane protein